MKWRASTKTVRVVCVKDTVKGVAAANAVSDTTPHAFRALCPVCGQPLTPVKKQRTARVKKASR